MQMVEVYVSDLIGPALDWTMATIEELPITYDPMAFGPGTNGGYWIWDERPKGLKEQIGKGYSPSTNWSQLGPLILKYPVVLGNHESGLEDGEFWGSAHCFHSHTRFQTNHGLMVAACRAMIALNRGTTVSIPKMLVNPQLSGASQ